MGKDERQVFKIRPVLAEYGLEDWHESLGWVAVKCPFHDDGSASASAIEHADGSGGFNCHVDGIKGDAIELIKQQEGVGFGEAVKRYEAIAGEKVSRISQSAQKSASKPPARLSDRGKRVDRSNSRSLSDRRGGRAGRRRPR